MLPVVMWQQCWTDPSPPRSVLQGRLSFTPSITVMSRCRYFMQPDIFTDAQKMSACVVLYKEPKISTTVQSKHQDSNVCMLTTSWKAIVTDNASLTGTENHLSLHDIKLKSLLACSIRATPQKLKSLHEKPGNPLRNVWWLMMDQML